MKDARLAGWQESHVFPRPVQEVQPRDALQEIIHPPGNEPTYQAGRHEAKQIDANQPDENSETRKLGKSHQSCQRLRVLL